MFAGTYCLDIQFTKDGQKDNSKNELASTKPVGSNSDTYRHTGSFKKWWGKNKGNIKYTSSKLNLAKNKNWSNHNKACNRGELEREDVCADSSSLQPTAITARLSLPDPCSFHFSAQWRRVNSQAKIFKGQTFHSSLHYRKSWTGNWRALGLPVFVSFFFYT